MKHVHYSKAANGYFLDFGDPYATGGRISWMPRHMLRVVGTNTSLFHLMWWSHKRGIHHHLRFGKFQSKWWYFV